MSEAAVHGADMIRDPDRGLRNHRTARSRGTKHSLQAATDHDHGPAVKNAPARNPLSTR